MCSESPTLFMLLYLFLGLQTNLPSPYSVDDVVKRLLSLEMANQVSFIAPVQKVDGLANTFV